MWNRDKAKQEIQLKLNTMSDFLKIEFLEKTAKQELGKIDLDVKKFCHLKLAELYASKVMYIEAAKNIECAAEISIKYSEKIGYYKKVAEIYIKAGKYNFVDGALKKALLNANSREKEEIKTAINNFYMRKAESYELQKKRNSAVAIYEKLLRMNPAEEQRIKIKKKLLPLYEKLGKIREFMALKSG